MQLVGRKAGAKAAGAAGVGKSLFLHHLYSLGAHYVSRTRVQKCTRIYGLVKKAIYANEHKCTTYYDEYYGKIV